MKRFILCDLKSALGDFAKIYEEDILSFLLSLIQNQDNVRNQAYRRVRFQDVCRI